MNREHRIEERAAAALDSNEAGLYTVEPDLEGGRTRLAAGQDPIKRQQILEGAQNVFLRMGFDAASMNDITREAGVSKGTIYVPAWLGASGTRICHGSALCHLC